ncbi:hypothetical protein GALL_57510 [mine drainage metagenome]|uniref:VanZ like family protein n=1 Tax=mine drainage metagenome TaxID=410659 RepID=A0A1J5TG60_9ZZZZ
MKIKFRHIFLIGSSIVLLLLGTINYFIFRPNILLFSFFNIPVTKNIIHSSVAIHFFSWYFSDITWCAALSLTVVAFSELQLIRNNISKILILSLPFVTEAAQGFHLIGGTFDINDILCYSIIIFLINILPPLLISVNMKKVKEQLWPAMIFIIFLAMAVASVPNNYNHHTYHKPVPQPCVTHKGLSYSPVLLKVNLTGYYTMKDLPEAQRTVPDYIVNKLNSLSYGKYSLANGVTPNLTLNITYTTDSYQHYGAEIRGYVYDGDFYITLPANYITFEKLDDDIADKVNTFINYGWCRNCPQPCNP